MTARNKAMHPLSVLHLVVMVAVLVWWSAFFWRQGPARDLMESRRPLSATRHLHRPDGPVKQATEGFDARLETAGAAIRAALADAVGGLTVLIMFALGTGIYVRRFEIWLQARGSGEGVALASEGLADKTLAANSERPRRAP